MRSLKRALKWAFIVIGGLVAIALVINAFWVWSTDARLERKLAEIQAAGEPVSLADLRPEPIPPEQDAATYLRRARADLRAMNGEIADAFAAASREVKQRGVDSDSPETLPEPDLDRHPMVLEAVRSAVAAYPKVMPLLRQAADCPKYSAAVAISDLDASDHKATVETILLEAQENREAARLMGSYWPSVLLTEGKRDEAVRSAITVLKLTRHFDGEPSMVNFLVAAACRGVALAAVNEALQAGPVSNDVRQELEEELAKHDVREAFAKNLLTERAFGLEAFRDFPGENNWFARAFFNRWKFNYLDIMQWHIDEARAASSREESTSGEQPESSNPCCSLLIPSLEASRKASLRCESMINAVRVLNALQQRENPDAMPAADLSDLGLPKQATLDAFNDKPLVVKKVPGGWLIYSVGENLKDDGGQIKDGLLDHGIEPKRAANP